MKKLKTFITLLIWLACAGNLQAHQNQFSVLFNNTLPTSNNGITTITFVSVPFQGHCNILIKTALKLSQHKNVKINFVITGWQNIPMREKNLHELMQAGIDVHILNDAPLTTPAPMTFTFPRAIHLVDETIERAKKSDLIVYDFFSIEGFLAGEQLGIPTICSIPAIIAPFNPNDTSFLKGIRENQALIHELEKKFDVGILHKLEMISDGFLLPSEHENIIWSWQNLIETHDFQRSRSLKNPIFMRPEKSNADDFIPLKKNQKLIYLSFGTVVTQNLWDNVPQVQPFVTKIIDQLIKDFGEKPEYQFIVSTGRKPQDIIPNPPSNFHVFKHVPQESVLEQADLFITHGGGNSVNEAIDANTPMIVIPFFGDQHFSAACIERSNIGIAFLHHSNMQEQTIDTEFGRFERESLSPMSNLTNAIFQMLNSRSFKEALETIRQTKPKKESWIWEHNFVFTWKEGDLLYGTNNDRKEFVALLNLESRFKIGDTKPFSQLFSECTNNETLPKIIDQYHDVLRQPTFFSEEVNTKIFPTYKNHLLEYHQFLLDHPAYIQPLNLYPPHLNNVESLETIWNMCLGGLDFFIHKKNILVHFVIKNYNSQLNKATRKELSWIKERWETVKNNVKFYLVRENNIILANPEAYNWFETQIS